MEVSYNLGAILSEVTARGNLVSWQGVTGCAFAQTMTSSARDLFSLCPVWVLGSVPSECSSNINWCLVLKSLSRLHLKARTDLAPLLDSVPTTLCCFREKKPVQIRHILSLASLSSQVTISQHHLNPHSSPVSAFWYSAQNQMITHLMLDLVSAMPLWVAWCLNVSWETHLVRITSSPREYKNLWDWLSCSGLTQSSVTVKPVFLPNLLIYLSILTSTQPVLSFCLSYLRRI